MKASKRDTSLAKNTFMLYALTGSNYILGFITIPYLARVLGAEVYGAIGFGQAVATYIQLVLDFGFLLSVTAEIAQMADDRTRVSATMSAALQAKAILCIGCAAAVFIVCLALPQFGNNSILIALYFAYAMVNSFMPDFVYRGLEMMSAITYRTIAAKTFFVVCIFIFVHSPEDYLLVPFFYFIGSFIAICIVYLHLRKRLNIQYKPAGMHATMASLRRSSGYFASRIASTVYSTMNYFVIGLLYPSSSALGCFTATDRAITAGKSASSPIADSLYPYMLRTKNYKLLIRISILGSGILTAICVVAFIWAEPICALLFGSEYIAAAPMLRILLPAIPLALVSYLYGFPALTPVGKADFANLSVILGACLQVILLLIFYTMGSLTVTGICLCTLTTETFVAVSRVLVFAKAYKAQPIK